MALKISNISTKTTTDQLVPEFFEIWDDVEVTETKRFDEFGQMDSWLMKNRSGSDWLAFHQDGSWARVFDFSQVFVDQDEQLCSLSKRFGVAVMALAETISGTYWFKFYENGSLKRQICSEPNGQLILVGEPLENEFIVNGKQFRLTELERTLEALQLRPYAGECPGPFELMRLAEP